MSYQQQYYPAPSVPQQNQAPAATRQFKGGFHPLYIWSLACLILTYAYIFIFAFATSLFSLVGNGSSSVPFIFFLFPLFLTIANIVISIVYRRRIDRRYFLGASIILKYGLIPYFIVGGLLIVIFFLLIFTPVVIMVFVSPPIIITLLFLGWCSMSESAPFMIVYFVNAAKEAAKTGKKSLKVGGVLFAVFGGIMQMFFCLDVLAAEIACYKERRHVILTTIVIVLPIVIFVVGVALIIIKIFTSGG